jgi:hypothetical protein
VEIKDPPSVSEVYVKLISEQWVGLDVHSSMKLQQPRETIPLKAKNSIEKYLKKQGLDYVNPSNKQSNPQKIKQTKSSIVDQIKDISQKRLGNTLNTTLSTVTLNKYAYSPTKKSKLLPSLNQPQNMEDEETDAFSHFNSSEKCPIEQMNPEINFRHIKPQLITDEQVYSLHKPSSLQHTEHEITSTQADDQVETFLQYQSTNLLKHPEMPVNQCQVTKCNNDPDEQNIVELQDIHTVHSASTQHTLFLRAGRTGSKYEEPESQEPNKKNLPQKEICHETDFMLNGCSTPKLTKDCHQPLKENVTLREDSTMQVKHLKKQEIKTEFISRSITPLKSHLEYPETKKSAIINSQLASSCNLHNNSLMKECSSEELETEDFNFQNGTNPAHKYVTPASTLSLDAQCNLQKKHLKTETLQTNMSTCDNNLGLKNKFVAALTNVQAETTGSESEHHKQNNSVIMSHDTAVHASHLPIDSQQAVTNTNQNVDSLHTKETTLARKILIFQKALPKNYYPTFIRSLEYDTNGPAELSSSNYDQWTEPSNMSATSQVMKEIATLTESGEKVSCTYYDTRTASSENVTKGVTELHPCTEKEANYCTPVHTKTETPPLLPQSSDTETQGSVTSEHRLQVHGQNNTQTEKTDMESQPKNSHAAPNFDLVKDFDSFLDDMSSEENANFKCANKSNKKRNDSFMANVPTPTRYSAMNNYVCHIDPHNSHEDTQRSRKNDSKYERILNLLLKDASRRDAMPSSSTVRTHEQSETKVYSQLLSSEFQFQPKKKVTLSHFTQKSLSHDSATVLNHNSDHSLPHRKAAQTLKPQSKNCDGKHIHGQINYQPLVPKGFTKIMCGSDTLSGDMNEILQKNETHKSWNVSTAINIPTQQPLLSSQTKPYTHISEYGNSSCKQPWSLPFEEKASKTSVLFQPAECVTGNTKNPSSLNSRWQKFEMSPTHSDELSEYY